MKNKVLRLAIVVVLVVAMTLSMTACYEDTVTPTPTPTVTPTKTPDKTPGKTPTPTITPDVSTSEATLEAKYGITFPVPEDLNVEFLDVEKYLAEQSDLVEPMSARAAEIKVPAVGSLYVPDPSTAMVTDNIKFGAKKPNHNDTFIAYKDSIAVTAKVTGLTKEGAKIELNEITNPETWATYAPTKAGTYTVVYTVKVAFTPETEVAEVSPAPNDVYGYFVPAKLSETYSVTKVYEVGKKALTIESVSDAKLKAASLAYPPATLKVGDLKLDAEKTAVLTELKLAGADAKYDLSIDIVSSDLTNYGAYPLTLVCLDGKGQKVDLATLVAADFEVSFKNGNRYVLTDAELANVVAARDNVLNAAKTKSATSVAATKEEIELGVKTYAGLTEGEKTSFLQTPANALNALAMLANNNNLSKVGMVEEALKLAKIWNDKLQNAEDAKVFITYMLSLSTVPAKDETESDYDYVFNALNPAAADKEKSYLDEALALVDEYKKLVLKEFAAAYKTAFESLGSLTMGDQKYFDQTDIDKIVEAVAAAQKKFDALVAGQEKLTVRQANALFGDIFNSGMEGVGEDKEYTLSDYMAMFSMAAKEFTARYAAFATLIDGLDAYTGDKVTGSVMSKMLGYNFHAVVGDDGNPIPDSAKKVNGKNRDDKSAGTWLFGISNSLFDCGYLRFIAPMLFVDNVVKSYKTLVDAYVALDASIVSAQKDVIANLGSKIRFAVDPKVAVEEFDANGFKNGMRDTAEQQQLLDVTRLQAMQNYIAETAITAVSGDLVLDVKQGVDPFADLAKKELSVIIAAALKEPIAVVNEYI
ncbi:MAG: hypothetical protein RR327_05540, partial [Clostridia bacterium]